MFSLFFRALALFSSASTQTTVTPTPTGTTTIDSTTTATSTFDRTNTETTASTTTAQPTACVNICAALPFGEIAAICPSYEDCPAGVDVEFYITAVNYTITPTTTPTARGPFSTIFTTITVNAGPTTEATSTDTASATGTVSTGKADATFAPRFDRYRRRYGYHHYTTSTVTTTTVPTTASTTEPLPSASALALSCNCPAYAPTGTGAATSIAANPSSTLSGIVKTRGLPFGGYKYYIKRAYVPIQKRSAPNADDVDKEPTPNDPTGTNCSFTWLQTLVLFVSCGAMWSGMVLWQRYWGMRATKKQERVAPTWSEKLKIERQSPTRSKGREEYHDGL